MWEIWLKSKLNLVQHFEKILNQIFVSAAFSIFKWFRFYKLRPIELYWALLKRAIKKRSSAATDINSFKRKLDGAVKTIDEKTVQNLMGGIKGKVRKFGRSGEI